MLYHWYPEPRPIDGPRAIAPDDFLTGDYETTVGWTPCAEHFPDLCYTEEVAD